MNFRLNITGGFPYSVAMFDSEPKSHIRSHGFPPCCQKTQEVQGQGGPSCCDAACWVVFLPAPVQKNKFQSHPPCLKKTLWVWDWAMIRSRFKDSHLVLQVSAFPRSNVGSRHTLKDSKRAFGIFCIGVFLVLCPGNLSSGAAHLFIAEFSHHSEECPVIRWTNAVGMYKPLFKDQGPIPEFVIQPIKHEISTPGNLREPPDGNHSNLEIHLPGGFPRYAGDHPMSVWWHTKLRQSNCSRKCISKSSLTWDAGTCELGEKDT